MHVYDKAGIQMAFSKTNIAQVNSDSPGAEYIFWNVYNLHKLSKANYEYHLQLPTCYDGTNISRQSDIMIIWYIRTLMALLNFVDKSSLIFCPSVDTLWHSSWNIICSKAYLSQKIKFRI